MKKDNENIALMYLSEQTSPSDASVKNLNIFDKIGSTYATFEACLHSFDVLNRNRRMYDGGNVWECIEKSDRIQDGLRKHCWGGECDHPGQDFENAKLTAERVQKILMPNISHLIIKPEMKGDRLVSIIETYSGTDVGMGMCRAMAQGLIPSFSCRSIATMKYKDGKPYVFVRKIVTYDWVLYPSHKEAEETGTAEFKQGAQKFILESANSDKNEFELPFSEYSKDIYIPMAEMADFDEFIKEYDENTHAIMESGMYDDAKVVGADPNTSNIILESGSNTIYVNTSISIKNAVRDFLTSF